jgi:polyphosphate kinase
VFNLLTSLGPEPRLKRILLAPFGMLPGMLKRIQRETAHALAGRPARIVAKMNALLDSDIITALYEASAAGVQIELIVRGICALRPQLPGISENIRVRSIVGRYLEHSRIYSFENGGDPEVWLGSADWMPRNLRRRVEVLFPIDDPVLKDRLRRRILSLYLADNVKARELLSDGDEVRRVPVGDAPELSSQTAFMQLAHGAKVDYADAFGPGSAAPRPPALPATGDRAKQKEPRERATTSGPLTPGGPVAGSA